MRGLLGAEQRDDDRQPDGDLRRRDRDDEKHQHLRVVAGQAVVAGMEPRKRDKREVRRVEHQLQPHENNQDVPPQQNPRQPDRKQAAADKKVIGKGWHLRKMRNVNTWSPGSTRVA